MSLDNESTATPLEMQVAMERAEPQNDTTRVPGAIYFPIWPKTEDGFCTCRKGKACTTKPGKHPKVSWSKLTGSCPIIEPGDYTAIVTGEKSQIFVVDLDDKNGKSGSLAWEQYCAGRDVPETYTVRTTSGGFHLYFKHPGFKVVTDREVFGEGVDVRGDGGIVVAPPSLGYTIEKDVPIAEAPAWLLADPALKGKETVADFEFKSSLTPEQVAKAIAWAKRWIDEEAPESIEGQGGDVACFKVACKVVAYYQVPPTEALKLLEYWSEKKANPTWDSGLLIYKIQRALREMPSILYFVESDEHTKDMKTELAKPSTPTKYKTDAGHSYSFVPGQTPQVHTELKKIGLNELVKHLRGWQWPEWQGVWLHNEFKDTVLAVNPPLRLEAENPYKGLSKLDVVKVKTWIESRGKTASGETVFDAILAAASASAYHPVRDYLAALPKTESTDYIDGFAKNFLGNDEPICEVLVRKFLISAVARILDPGCKVDTMLVLYGKQGTFKSTLLETLFGQEHHTSQMSALQTKDASETLRGMWCVEFGELDRLTNDREQAVKEFLTRRIDNYRRPYEVGNTLHQRTAVFAGTTNESQFLRDEQGEERRYWPVSVRKEIPIKDIDRDRLWSEALFLYHRDKGKEFAWWLTPEEKAACDLNQKPFQVTHSWEPTILEYCAGKTYVSVKDIFIKAINQGDPNCLKNLQPASNVIKRILRKNDFEECPRDFRALVEGKRWTKGIAWKVPKEIREANRELDICGAPRQEEIQA